MMFHRPINETDAPKFQRDVRSAVVQMAAHARQVLTTVVRRGAGGNLMHGWAHEATAGGAREGRRVEAMASAVCLAQQVFDRGVLTPPFSGRIGWVNHRRQ